MIVLQSAAKAIVPKEQPRIARRFNAGISRLLSQVPQERLNFRPLSHFPSLHWHGASKPNQRYSKPFKANQRSFNFFFAPGQIRLIFVPFAYCGPYQNSPPISTAYYNLFEPFLTPSFFSAISAAGQCRPGWPYARTLTQHETRNSVPSPFNFLFAPAQFRLSFPSRYFYG